MTTLAEFDLPHYDPIVKCLGGKRQLLKQLSIKLPSGFNRDKLNEEERREIVAMEIACRNIMDLIEYIKERQDFENKKLEDLR